jgi:hypothetical protein
MPESRLSVFTSLSLVMNALRLRKSCGETGLEFLGNKMLAADVLFGDVVAGDLNCFIEPSVHTDDDAACGLPPRIFGVGFLGQNNLALSERGLALSRLHAADGSGTCFAPPPKHGDDVKNPHVILFFYPAAMFPYAAIRSARTVRL